MGHGLAGRYIPGKCPGILLLFCSCALFTTLNAKDLQVGFSEFRLESPGFSPAASALFRLINPEGVLVSEAGVGAVSPIRRGRIFVQRTDRSQTGVAFANSSDQSVSLRLVLRSSNGQELGRIDSLELSAFEHLAQFVEQLFPSVPGAFLGSLTFEGLEASDKVSAVTIRQSQNAHNEPLLATLPVVDLDSFLAEDAELIFPQIGAGPGLTTQLVLINKSSEVTVGQVHLTSSNGTPLQLQLEGGVGSMIPFSIPANGVFLTEMDVPVGVEIGVGYARVEVTEGQIPSGTAIFRFVESEQPVSEAGVAASSSMGRARLFLDRRETSTGFAVVNPNSSSITLHLRVYDGKGSMIEEVEHLLPSKNHMARFASEFFALPDQFVGLLEIASEKEFIPITLKLSQNLRNQSILTTLPVANLSQPDSEELLVAPQLGVGESGVGDFVTSLIFIAPIQQERIDGSLRFWQGKGDPLEPGSLGSELEYVIEAGAAGEILLADQTRPPVLKRGESVSATIGPEGGELFIGSCAGSSITLDLPPFALLESRELTMTCLAARPVSTLGTEVFPGVALEPSGLFFLEPVTLTIVMPERLEDSSQVALLGLGLRNFPEPVSGALTGDHLLSGDLIHFSEYWGEEFNLSDLLFWAEAFKGRPPEQRDAVRELFRRSLGNVQVDELTLDLLVDYSDFLILQEYEGFKEELDAPTDSIALAFLDQLVTKFLTSSIPSQPCGYYHALGLEIRSLSDALLGSNPTLNSRIAQLDSQCIRVDLNGLWRTDASSGSERCYRDVEEINTGCPIGACEGGIPTDIFSESDTTESFLFSVTQTGSAFTISFPSAPDEPPLHGHLHGTGNEEFPYSFSASIMGSNSIDCRTFFETDGEFDFGETLCEPIVPGACEALSCWEKNRIRGRVGSNGMLIRGSDSWTLRASVHDRPGGCCSTKTYLQCTGSQAVTARKQ